MKKIIRKQRTQKRVVRKSPKKILGGDLSELYYQEKKRRATNFLLGGGVPQEKRKGVGEEGVDMLI